MADLPNPAPPAMTHRFGERGPKRIPYGAPTITPDDPEQVERILTEHLAP
jgi:hypothetical protein